EGGAPHTTPGAMAHRSSDYNIESPGRPLGRRFCIQFPPTNAAVSTAARGRLQGVSKILQDFGDCGETGGEAAADYFDLIELERADFHRRIRRLGRVVLPRHVILKSCWSSRMPGLL